MADGGCGFDVCGLKYVSHRHRFIYFEVPKTGTSSILRLLREHASIEKMSRRLEFLESPEYRRFALVRNPWDRLLSCFRSKIKPDPSFEDEHFKDGVMRKFHRFGVFRAGMPFDEFVHAVGAIPDDLADGHFASQHPRLVMDGEIVVDHLARFEDFQNATRDFLRRVGVDAKVEVPHLNRSDNRRPYTDYYTPETKRVVEERFAEDLRLFDYAFEAEGRSA